MRCGIWAIIVGLTLLSVTPARADGDDWYIVPLIEPYILSRHDQLQHEYGSPYEIGERSSIRSWDSSTVLRGVKRLVVVDKAIIGNTTQGFFILQPDREDLPQEFTTESDWKAALKVRGIDPATPPLDPESLTAGVPDRVLRPWKYRVMNAWLGWTDDFWSLALQILALALSLVFGLMVPETRALIPVTALFGLVANVVAQLYISGGGPGFMVGCIALPIFCVLAAKIGSGVRLVIPIRKRVKPPTPSPSV